VSYIAASLVILAFAIAVGFAWYERAHPTARVIALVATLAALAALGRIAFAPLPNVKPTTDIVLLSGYVLGGAPGFAVGAVAALASNLFFGQGPWTPWQMVAWGGVGVAGAVLARVAGRELGRVSLAAACAIAGLAFGAVMNLHLWVNYSGDHTLEKLVATFATSFPFDVAHAVGNALFCLAFGPALVRALSRYRTRFEVTWLAAPAAGALLLVAVLAAAAPPSAQAGAKAAGRADAAAARASERYLLRAQNDDGGWGAAPDQGSSQLYTGWTALGLAAAGRNPRDAGSPSALAYIRSHARELNDLGEINRTILVLRAAGMRPRLGGRDLERDLVAAQRPNGSFAGRVNTTAFAVLALRAAGRSPRSRAVRRAAGWIAGQANDDGGFNFSGRGGPSGVDDTGAALQALGAAGRRRSRVTQRAARFLVRSQASDGGFALIPGGPSNAQSTAWAVQGLLAAGRDPARVRRRGSRDPMSYLRSLTAPSGEVRYSRTSRQTPVWVTAQAVMALARKPLPLARVPRERRRARPAAEPPPPAPAPAARRRRPQPLPPVGSPDARSRGNAERAVRGAAAMAAAATATRSVGAAVAAATLPARAGAAGVLVAIAVGAVG
jgi:energy-coupling factor transport system substrate-specific component